MKAKTRKPRAGRNHWIERLEDRYLLAAAPFGQNPLGPLDVTRDGSVTALDALRVINALGRQDGGVADPSRSPGDFIDVNGSGEGTALDALLVINSLGRELPILALTLPDDSAPQDRADLEFDLRTNDYGIDLHVSVADLGSRSVELQIGDSGTVVDLSERFADGLARLTMQDIDNFFGSPLPDGDHTVEARLSGQPESIQFVLTVDRESPTPQVDLEHPVRVAPDALSIDFGESVVVDGGDVGLLSVSLPGAPAIVPSKLEANGNSVRFQLPSRLVDGQFDLSVAAGIEDLAGNVSEHFSTQFVVADPTGISSVSPASGEQMVSVTREVIVRFDEPIDPATIDPDPTNPDDDAIVVMAGGRRVPGRLRVSSTQRFATYFYDNPLPASTEVRVQIAGDQIRGRDGLALDAEADNEPGGTRAVAFRTLPLTRIPGTELFGFVKDSQTQEPIEGVIISLDAHPQVRATTDATGFFELGVDDIGGDGFSDGLPAPEFFVHIDGSGAESPDGTVYASLGKPFHSLPGQREQLNMAGEPFDIFLPRIAADAPVAITPGQQTVFGFGNSDVQMLREMFPNADEAMLSSMQVTIPDGSAVNDFGDPASAAFVVPVDPDFLPAPLPPGLDPSLVVSIQAPGATNFDVPASVSFPNLDGLAPGEKTLLFSFDHDAGRFVVNGTATVSEDGMSVVSDPGVGINAPGWHFIFDFIRFIAGGGGGAGGDGGCVGFFCEPEDKNETATFEFGVIAQGRSPGFDLGAAVEVVIPGLIDFPEDPPEANLPPQTFGPNILLNRTFTVDSDGLFATLLRRLTGSLDLLVLDAKLRGEAAISASSGGIAVNQGDTHVVVQPPSAGLLSATVSLKVGGAACRAGASIVPGLSALCGVGLNFGVGDFPPGLGALLSIVPLSLPDTDGDGQPGPAEEDFNAILSFKSGFFVEVDFGSLEVTAFLREIREKALKSAAQITDARVVGEGESEILPYSSERSIGNDPRSFYRIFPVGFNEVFGRTNNEGAFETTLPPETDFTMYVYHPASNTHRVQTGRTSASGSVLTISTAREFFGGVDTDGDGIPDVGEVTIGTSPEKADTDDDGISDSAEIAQGLDPLADRGFPTGVIASLSLPAPARKVVLAGSVDDGSRRTAYMATGAHGLAIVDASQFDNPVVLGQLDLEGAASDVAVDTQSGLAAVATGSGGLQLIDVSDPMLPRLSRILDGRFNQVESRAGIVYATDQRTITAIDFQSGQAITSLTLGGQGDIERLALEGETLYALDDQQRLTVVTIDGQELVERGNLLMFGLDGDLFVADGVVYVTARNNEGRGGYLTVDVSDPSQPTLISGVDAPEQGAPSAAMVTNGSGTGLLVGTLERVIDQPSVLTLLDVSDSASTFDPIGQFLLPAVPHDVAVASGIAFVASDTGLQVVNYLPFDNQGNPPTAGLSVDEVDLDADPEAAGLQLLEGVRFPVTAAVTDDVQVRNVEVLLDGRVIDNAVTFPFDLAAFAPVLAEGESISQHQLQLRATDTGGNVTRSEPLMFQVIPDLIAPTIDRFEIDLSDVDPSREGDQVLEAQTLTIRFDASDVGGIERIELVENDVLLRTVEQPTGVLAYTTPLLQPEESIAAIDLVLRAFDFAGNVTQSDLLSFEIVPDTFGPQIIESTLNAAGVRLLFDEPLAAAAVTGDRFEIRGPDNQVLPIDDLQLLNADRVVLLRFRVSRPGDYVVTIAASEVTDRLGNPLGQEPVVLNLQATDRSPYLFPSPKLIVGDEPVSLLSADLNLDNLPDLITVNRDSGDLSVLMATGNGKYRQETRVAVGANPSDAVAADFSGDGLVDLAVTFPDTDQLKIFLQDTGGGFTESATITVGARPSQVESSDFNGDGTIDLATANETSDDASVLLGLAGGAFADPLSVDFGPSFSLSALAVADFNGDGITDLGAAEFESFVVRLGDGAGAFQQPQATEITGSPSEHLTTSDFNGDGNLDVALSLNFSGEVSLLFGDGQGGFTGQQSIVSFAADRPDALESLDFDADGNVDLAVTVRGADDRLVILRNLGDGQFAEIRQFSLSDLSLFSLVTGDFDADGSEDVAVASSSNDDVSLFFDIGGSSFPRPIRIDLLSGGSNSVVTADFNGDQLPDIVSAGFNQGRDITILLSTTEGFAEPQFVFEPDTPGTPFSVHAVDVNDDGLVDIIATLRSSGEILVLLGGGDGTFEEPIRFDSFTGDPAVIATADFNQDQHLDLAFRGQSNRILTIFLGAGDGTFTFLRQILNTSTLAPSGLNSDRMLTTGDFNEDGLVDLATVDLGGESISILLGDGTGDFAEPILVTTCDFPIALAVDDFNADGILDIAVANGAGKVSVLVGLGNAAFAEVSSMDTGAFGTISIISNDLNLDGTVDLVTVNRLSNDVAVLLGTGDGSFGRPLRFGAGPFPLSIVAEDLNADGLIDLLAANRSTGVTLLRNQLDLAFASVD